jgi:hypothetical protein
MVMILERSKVVVSARIGASVGVMMSRTLVRVGVIVVRVTQR